MAADWVELGKEVLKLAVRARYSFSLWLTSLLILVAPLPSFLRLDGFRQEYGQHLGLVCLIMFVVWVVEVTLMALVHVKTYLLSRREEKKTLEYLDSLNSREAHLLVFAVSNKIQTVTWRQDGDEVSSLMAKGLLSLVPDKGTMYHKPYTIPRFVWEEISRGGMLAKLRALDKESGI